VLFHVRQGVGHGGGRGHGCRTKLNHFVSPGKLAGC
jgi:hypothetical protein